MPRVWRPRASDGALTGPSIGATRVRGAAPPTRLPSPTLHPRASCARSACWLAHRKASWCRRRSPWSSRPSTRGSLSSTRTSPPPRSLRQSRPSAGAPVPPAMAAAASRPRRRWSGACSSRASSLPRCRTAAGSTQRASGAVPTVSPHRRQTAPHALAAAAPTAAAGVASHGPVAHTRRSTHGRRVATRVLGAARARVRLGSRDGTPRRRHGLRPSSSRRSPRRRSVSVSSRRASRRSSFRGRAVRCGST